MPFQILVDEPIMNGEESNQDAYEPDPEEMEEDSYEYIWNLGEKRPFPNGHPYWLRATDAELEYIKMNFENVPFKRHVNECVWHGEWAAFIFSNL